MIKGGIPFYPDILEYWDGANDYHLVNLVRDIT